MTIHKDIEILSNNGLKPDGTTWGEYLKAVKLGLEALKVIERDRNLGMPWAINQLPGEDPE